MYAIIAAAVTILTGCLLLAPPAEAQVNWKQSSGKELRILNLEQPYSQGLAKLFPEFEKETGIKVSQETMAQLAVIQKIGVELAGGTGAYDLVFAEGSSLPQYIKGGWIQPIDEYMQNPKLTDPKSLDANDIIKSTLDAMKVEGKQYGLPFFAATVMMYYRKDVFEKYGIKKAPDNYDELVEILKKVHTKDMPGIALRGQPGAVMNIWHWSMFLYGYGGKFFKDYPKDMHPVFDSPGAIKATDVYAQIMQNYSIPGAASATFDDVVTAMQQGNVAIALEGAPLGGRILDPEKSKVIGKLGFGLVPGGPAGRFPPFTAQGFAIASASKNKEAAYLFLQWATSKDTLLKVALNSRHVAVTRNKVWEDTEFLKKYNFDFGAGSYIKAFQETLKVAPFWYRPAIPEFNKVGDRLGIAVQEAIVKRKSAAEAMKDANADIDRMMKEAGYYK